MSSPEVSASGMTRIIGQEPDFLVRRGEVSANSILGRRSGENVWEISESGNDATDAALLIERVRIRLEPSARGLRSLSEQGCTALLSIVQYLSEDDRSNPGFSIGRAMIEFLASVDAEVDIDQYVGCWT